MIYNPRTGWSMVKENDNQTISSNEHIIMAISHLNEALGSYEPHRDNYDKFLVKEIVRIKNLLIKLVQPH